MHGTASGHSIGTVLAGASGEIENQHDAHINTSTSGGEHVACAALDTLPEEAPSLNLRKHSSEQSRSLNLRKHSSEQTKQKHHMEKKDDPRGQRRISEPAVLLRQAMMAGHFNSTRGSIHYYIKRATAIAGKPIYLGGKILRLVACHASQRMHRFMFQ